MKRQHVWGPMTSMGHGTDTYHQYCRDGRFGICGSAETGWCVVHSEDGVEDDDTNVFPTMEDAREAAEILDEKMREKDALKADFRIHAFEDAIKTSVAPWSNPGRAPDWVGPASAYMQEHAGDVNVADAILVLLDRPDVSVSHGDTVLRREDRNSEPAQDNQPDERPAPGGRHDTTRIAASASACAYALKDARADFEKAHGAMLCANAESSLAAERVINASIRETLYRLLLLHDNGYVDTRVAVEQTLRLIREAL